MFCVPRYEDKRVEEQERSSVDGNTTINADELIGAMSFWGELQPPPRQKRKKPARIRNQRVHSRDSLSLSPGSSKESPIQRTPVWKTAIDPVSNRVYYYDAITRRTQWEKPREVKEMEKRRKQEKRRQDRQFFRDMEQNIYQSLARNELIPGVEQQQQEVQQETAVMNSPVVEGPRQVRTISGMDEMLLQELKRQENGEIRQIQQHLVPTQAPTASRPARDEHGRPPLPSRQPLQDDTLEFSPDQHERKTSGEHTDPEELRGELFLDGPIDEDLDLDDEALQQPNQPQQQHHVRRNTGGTIRFQSTMTNPNIEATIQCVCGVYRAHILQETGKRHGSPVSVVTYPLDEIAEIFMDAYGTSRGRRSDPHQAVPPLQEIISFYCDFYNRSKMEHDTIIMSLIYVERLIKETNGYISPVPENWKSLLFSCMVLASKVWDDMSMWNIDFSNVCGGRSNRTAPNPLAPFTLERINQLELALLKSLNFNVKVRASEYAKYYFLIRSMLIKSGLLQENDDPIFLTPMNGGGNNYLQEINKSLARQEQRHSTPPKHPNGRRQQYKQQPQRQQHALPQRPRQELPEPRSRRSHSFNDYIWLNEGNINGTGQNTQVCLEQLVSMDHR